MVGFQGYTPRGVDLAVMVNPSQEETIGQLADQANSLLMLD
jgi:hypothetical protein